MDGTRCPENAVTSSSNDAFVDFEREKQIAGNYQNSHDRNSLNSQNTIIKENQNILRGPRRYFSIYLAYFHIFTLLISLPNYGSLNLLNNISKNNDFINFSIITTLS